MSNERTCGLNYEAEYNRLLAENKELCEKLRSIETHHSSLETEFIRLRAQMDIVYLIFGGRK